MKTLYNIRLGSIIKLKPNGIQYLYNSCGFGLKTYIYNRKGKRKTVLFSTPIYLVKEGGTFLSDFTKSEKK